uniref:C-type lectin domain-containing protein n=1 Tax=Sinocyclocheilus rhinocerous TaxID=307959 RepID=A0A673HA34_9TELE
MSRYSGDWWIGLWARGGVAGVDYYWDNDALITYTNWGRNEPSNSTVHTTDPSVLDVTPENCITLFTVDFAQKKSWQAARDDCLARGADLVSIHSPEEEIFLSSYSKGKTKWIGLSVNPVEGGYHWSDGTPVSHTNWGHGEPNNHNGRENCVEMVTTENGTSWWNDLNYERRADPSAKLYSKMWS